MNQKFVKPIVVVNGRDLSTTLTYDFDIGRAQIDWGLECKLLECSYKITRPKFPPQHFSQINFMKIHKTLSNFIKGFRRNYGKSKSVGLLAPSSSSSRVKKSVNQRDS